MSIRVDKWSRNLRPGSAISSVGAEVDPTESRPADSSLETTKAGQQDIRSNSFWNALQQVVTLAASAVVSLALVFVLSVSDYGAYIYATSLLSVGMSIMTAGLAGLAIKAYIQNEENAAVTTSSIIVIREIFATIAFVVLGLVALTSGEHKVFIASAVALASLFARAADAPEIWFLSRLQSRATALARISTSVGFLAFRVLAAWLIPSLWTFLFLLIVEACAASAMILRRYLVDPVGPGIRPASRSSISNLLGQSWPLVLSNVANQINLKVDIVLIQILLGASAVGVYGVAARISELAYFLPVVVMNSTLPVLVAARRTHGSRSKEYNRMLQRSYDTAFWSGLAVAAVVSLLAPPLIPLVFGNNFSQSSSILLIHIWACPFVFVGAVYSKWIIAEGHLWSSLVRHLAGAILNVILNLTLVPAIGVKGSAVATLVSYAVSNYLICFVGSRSRSQGILMTSAATYPLRVLRGRFASARTE